MKQTERKAKIASFVIITLMLTSAFSGSVMVMASVNSSVNTTVTAVEAPIDTTQPTIIDYTPTGDNVSVNVSIQVTFSEAMNETSVECAFSLHPSVDGIFNWHGNEVTFIPDYLAYNTTYSITIKGEATDLAGNGLESSYSREFTTESQGHEDTISPSPFPSPPISILISCISAISVTANSTTITWMTDQPSDSRVKYGTETGNYTSFVDDPSSVTEHRI